MSAAEMAEAELRVARAQHRELDAQIAGLAGQGPLSCSLEMQRLKRRKLQLKDRIARLEDVVTPDIIA
ncbi:DUF465 domain-containing protein [Paracoccus suum]|uniref:DUF465 domain-containing protein n=1 Tax=Paracoccus suum TaxID=2259340 RepID=A0A344PKC0_9RHOB|nr:YdcH family protein [Paracoccus suum]AXC49825.1 DUF465 domain-containing protein [Paracoccus suum]